MKLSVYGLGVENKRQVKPQLGPLELWISDLSSTEHSGHKAVEVSVDRQLSYGQWGEVLWSKN